MCEPSEDTEPPGSGMATRLASTPSQLTDVSVERHVVRRGIAAVGLLGIALIHVLDLEGKLDELPYVGALFIGLIVVCLVLAEALIRTDNPLVWSALQLSPGRRSSAIRSAARRGYPVMTARMSAIGLRGSASPPCLSKASLFCSP
jgi:hypothetical protein